MPAKTGRNGCRSRLSAGKRIGAKRGYRDGAAARPAARAQGEPCVVNLTTYGLTDLRPFKHDV